MFHLYPKPSPPQSTGRDTIGHAVDSSAAVLVRDPLALLARVIEVEHRGHGIDPQPVDAVAVEPEQRIGEEKIRDLGAPVIVDERVPFEMAPLPGIGVLIDRGPIEANEPMRIVRKVPRNPVKDDGKAGAMAGINEGCEIGRTAEAARWRVQADRLIAPGAVEGVLAHRQKLDMGETQIADIGR